MSIKIMCTVSGGLTGTRIAELKEGGEVKEFPSMEAAQQVADRLNREKNGSYANASFHYQPFED